MASASRLTRVALGVGLVVMFWSKIGARLVLVTVQVKVSVSVVRAVADGDADGVGLPAGGAEARVPLMTPVVALIDSPRQAGGRSRSACRRRDRWRRHRG